MNEYILGQDKITCPIDITDGIIFIDGEKRYILKQGLGNALNAKHFTAVTEDGHMHGDILDMGRSEVMHYMANRISSRRFF